MVLDFNELDLGAPILNQSLDPLGVVKLEVGLLLFPFGLDQYLLLLGESLSLVFVLIQIFVG